MEKSKLNLWQKVAKVMEAVEYLKKDDTIGTGNNSYKGMSAEKVITNIRTHMISNGLIVTLSDQITLGIDRDTVNYQGKAGISRFTQIETTYKLIDVDTGEFELISSVGHAVDSQDKGSGKALTYAFKNMLLNTFMIPTGEDTDKVHNDDLPAIVKVSHSEVDEAVSKLSRCKTVEDVKKVWDKYTDLHIYDTFKTAVMEKKESCLVTEAQ